VEPEDPLQGSGFGCQRPVGEEALPETPPLRPLRVSKARSRKEAAREAGGSVANLSIGWRASHETHS